jgi:hypothetical protein
MKIVWGIHLLRKYRNKILSVMKMYNCSECENILIIPNNCESEGLFIIDDGAAMKSRDKCNKRLFHMCGDCREKNEPPHRWYNEVCNICTRCSKSTDCGIGKWNLNKGHIHCCTCGNLCYDCHGLVHYNK